MIIDQKILLKLLKRLPRFRLQVTYCGLELKVSLLTSNQGQVCSYYSLASLMAAISNPPCPFSISSSGSHQMRSLVKSSLNGNMACRITISHLVGYGVICCWINIFYRINEVFLTLSGGVQYQSRDQRTLA